MGNETRKPYKILLSRLPHISGKKSIKISQYKASKWRPQHHLGCNTFFPKVPLLTDDRNIYFAERFRVQIGTQWHMVGGYQYVMLAQGEVYRLLDEMEAELVHAEKD